MSSSVRNDEYWVESRVIKTLQNRILSCQRSSYFYIRSHTSQCTRSGCTI